MEVRCGGRPIVDRDPGDSPRIQKTCHQLAYPAETGNHDMSVEAVRQLGFNAGWRRLRALDPLAERPAEPGQHRRDEQRQPEQRGQQPDRVREDRRRFDSHATNMKNSPISKPRNGSIIASTSCRITVSSSSRPARNAPSAIDRPANQWKSGRSACRTRGAQRASASRRRSTKTPGSARSAAMSGVRARTTMRSGRPPRQSAASAGCRRRKPRGAAA